MRLRNGCLLVERLIKDKRGTSFEGIALSVSIVAVAFVASADMLDYMTKPHESAGMMASLHSATPASTGNANLDEMSTGSVPALVTRSVLDPCTGRIK